MKLSSPNMQNCDYFISQEDALEASKMKKQQTNLRYKNFCQTHFTAGDEEQFELHRNHCESTSNEIETLKKENNLEENIFNDIEFSKTFSKLNENLSSDVVLSTFKYLFYKFKKGIYVKINNNKVQTFLPFSNANFFNEWSNKINSNNEENLKIFQYVCEKNNYKFDIKSINSFKNSWYANNYLVRYEFPIQEGDTNVCNFKNMLDELCEKRCIPNIEFFINRRDFPLLHSKKFEPYDDLWDSSTQPLISHNYEKYLPIFSMSKKDEFDDILIPSHEDWARVQSKNNIFFKNSLRSCDTTSQNEIKWENKKPIALFRGSSTGRGVTIETNMRLKIAYLSSLNKIDEKDKNPYLDAGITKWNLRPRKLKASNKLQTIKIEDLPFGLTEFMKYEDQLNYKYIIHIDGHVSAFRLSKELLMNSVILLVENDWKLWYSNLLQPYVHYIPIKKDLSDIYEKINWCKENDDECKLISYRARSFALSYLEKDGILDYLQKLLFDLKDFIGNYHQPIKNICFLQNQKQLQLIQNKLNKKKEFKLNDSQYYVDKKIRYDINETNEILNSYEIIFTNKNKSIEIRKINYFEKDLIIKIANKEEKQIENIHEAFVGFFVINKLTKNIPNFCYTYNLQKNNENYNIISEFIDGISLYDFIKSDEFNINSYILILYQIAFALQIAQNNFKFVHYDLSSWNIILQKTKEQKMVTYQISPDEVFKIKTNIIPKIIDYGKSHVVYKNQHYGFVNNLFKFSSIHDIISLLITSIYQIISDKNLKKYEIQILLQLSSFFSNSKFCPKKFNSCKDLKLFLYSAKKYSNLLYNEKFELEELKPIDFINFIQKQFEFVLNKTYVKKENLQQLFLTKSFSCNKNIHIKKNNLLKNILSITIEEKYLTKEIFFNFIELQNIFIKYKILFENEEELKNILCEYAQQLQNNEKRKNIYSLDNFNDIHLKLSFVNTFNYYVNEIKKEIKDEKNLNILISLLKN
jgi:hypothetical protein